MRRCGNTGSNPVGATTIGRVIDFRLCQGIPSDQPIDREGSSELVAPFSALAHRLELDLVGEEFPEHLPRLGDMAPEQRLHILDLDQELGLDPRGVNVGGTEHAGEAVARGSQRVLPRLLCVEASGHFVPR